MKNNKTLYIVIAVLIIIGGGIFFFLNNKNSQKETGESQPTNNLPLGAEQTPEASVADKTMVDCGLAKDPACFVGRANGCLPVTVKMTGSDNKTEIGLTVLGIENDKCHFQRKINNTTDLNCYFPKGTNMMNAIDQTFGNDKGLQKVIDAACAGW